MKQRIIEILKDKKSLYYYVLSLVIALCSQASHRVIYSGNILGNYTDNYFRPATQIDLLIFICSFLMAMSLLVFLDIFLCSGKDFFRRLRVTPKTKPTILFMSLLVVVVYSLYFLSFFPGGIYSDTIASIVYSVEGTLTNRFPFLYNELVSFFIHLSYFFDKSLTWGFGIFLAVQVICQVLTIIYFMIWMVKRNFSLFSVVLSGLFFCFFPILPIYAIAIWKDTPFCISFLLWMIQIYDFVYDDDSSKGKVVLFSVFSMLVAFTRNNGPFIVAIVCFLLIITSKKHSMFKTSLLVCVTLTIFIIQGPIYNLLGVEKTAKSESFGIPIQQIAAVKVYDGVISAEQEEKIGSFFSDIDFKEEYSPCTVDSIKWSNHFSNEYFDNNVGEFIKLWGQLLAHNPQIYVRAYLLETLGYWDVTKTDKTGYIQTDIWHTNYFDIEEHDFINEWFGTSIKEYLMPSFVFSGAILLWIYLIVAVVVLKNKGVRHIIIYIPPLLIYVTIFLASPIAFSFRYVAPLLYAIPFMWLIKGNND